jgi:hypothetical protein
MYLAYLRQFSTDVGVLGCVVLLLGLATGALVGLVFRRLVEPMYWSTMCAAFAMVSVAAAPGLSTEFRLSWCMVGAASGGACAAPAGRHPVFRVAAGVLVAGLVMGLFVLLIRDRAADNLFDALTAPIIGGLIGVLITIVHGLELDRRLPRYLIATWLLCAVLVGNLLTMIWVYQR